MLAAQGRRGAVVNAAIAQANAGIKVVIAEVGAAAVAAGPPPVPSVLLINHWEYYC
jgi:hypothetical protein